MVGSARAETYGSSDLTRGYLAPAGGFDEIVEGSGNIKPHWQPLLQALSTLDPATRTLRMEQLNARVRETGIAHDLFADPASPTQPWRVDLVPLIIAPAEWRALERALIQRARLFEGILADLYGPQRLLASGAIPHQLVFSDPSFLRPCQRAAADRRLHPVLRHRSRARTRRALARDRHAHRDARPASAMRSPTAWCTPTSPATSSPPARRCGWRRSSSSCRPRWRAAPIAPTPPSPC